MVRSGWAMFTALRGAVLRCSLLVAAVGRDYNGRREDDLYSLKSICGCIAFGSGGLGRCSFVFVFCIVFIKLFSMGSAFGLNSCKQQRLSGLGRRYMGLIGLLVVFFK